MSIVNAGSPWVWFEFAALAATAGSVLLAIDRSQHSGQRSGQHRERRRWAALRGWRFVPADPTLAGSWRHGVLAGEGAGLAKDIVIGSLFSPMGRRAVRIFDHERGGQVSSVVIAVQRQVHAAGLVAELWLPGQPLPRHPELIMLGPVGNRVALVTEPDRAAALVSPEFVFALNALGSDIAVTWLEQDWVLAAAPCTVTPTRLERLLRTMDEIADLLDVAGLDKTGKPGPFADSADRATS